MSLDAMGMGKEHGHKLITHFKVYSVKWGSVEEVIVLRYIAIFIIKDLTMHIFFF